MLQYKCTEPPSESCKQSEILFVGNGTLAFSANGSDAPLKTFEWFKTLEHKAKWIRVELTHMNDFKYEGQINEVCEAAGVSDEFSHHNKASPNQRSLTALQTGV